MNISFDLDGLLIALSNEFQSEPLNFFASLVSKERLRKGTTRLIKDLQAEGHKIHIYTTSLRPKRKIRWLFRVHGILLDQIINQFIHSANPQCRSAGTTKFPPAFGIDVHIDDSPGVAIEGRKKNFNVIIVDPFEKNWAIILRNALLQFQVAEKPKY